MDKPLNLAIAALVLVLLGYATGRYVQPAKVVTETKEVIKEVQVVNKNVVTTEKEIKHPDGTVETDTTIQDKSTEQSTTLDNKDTLTTVTNAKPQWRLSAMAGKRSGQSLDQPMYGAIVERRILGPIFVGAWGTSGRDGGISVGLEF